MDEWKKVYIDQAEEINTVIAQLKSLPEDKLALVIDENNRLLTQKTNLKLLHLYLTKAGKEISLISQNQAVQEAAAEMNLLATLDQPEEQSLNKFAGYLERKYIYGVLLAVIVSLMIIYCVWPVREVEIMPQIRTVKSDLVVEFSPDFKEVSGSKLPARIWEKEVSLELTKPTTGKKVIGVTKASGKVMLINESSSTINLKAGTRICTLDGTNFLLSGSVAVPGRRVESFMGVPVGLIAGKAEAGVVAENPGIQGNVTAGSINKIAVNNLRVINPAPISGGEDKEVSVVSENDITVLEQELQQKVKKYFLQVAKKDLSKTDKLLNDSLSLQGITLRYDKNTGEQGDIITAKAKGTGRIFSVTDTDLEKAVSQFLQDKIGKSYLLVEQPTEIIWGAGLLLSPTRYKAEISASSLAEADLNERYWKKELNDLPLNQMKQRLSNSSEVASFKITGKHQISWLPDSWQKIKIILKNKYKKE